MFDRLVSMTYLWRGLLAILLLSSALAANGSSPTEDHLEFDGVDDHAEIPDSNDLDLSGGSFTLSAWIRPSGWGQNDQGRILDHGGGTSGGAGWSLHLENKASSGSPRALRVQINDDPSFDGISQANAIVLDVWQHVAVTLDSGSLTFYVDGVESGVRTGVPSPVPRGDPVRIGVRATDTGRAFLGAIDEVRIWSRALAQSEIQSYRDVELTGTEPGLVAYYRLNEGVGQTAADDAGGNDTARLGTTSGADASDPVWVTLLPPENQPPQVDAGPDQIIIWPADTVTLDASVTDDGLPDGLLTTTWSQVSGPGAAVFGDPSAVDTTATFSEAGAYLLRLTADDTDLTTIDDTAVRVDSEAVITSIVVTPDPVTLGLHDSQPFQAEGRDQVGDPLLIDPAWTATGGTIDITGLYTAGAFPGQYAVSATEGDVSGDATVTVTSDLLWPGEDWLTATPAEMGMDRTLLEEARDYALLGSGSGYITRDGRLVMTWGDDTTLYKMYSTTKSIASSALALALEEGAVSLDDLAQLHLPEIGTPPESNTATGWLDDIILRHLATHTAGFDKPGGYIDLLFEPGTVWAYSDGGLNWLGDTLTVVHGEDLNDLLFRRVFTPIGIDGSELTWRSATTRDDTIQGIKRREVSSGIDATVNAMTRFGYLFLRRGRWDDQLILPPDFVDRARTTVPGVVGLPVANDVASRFAGAPEHYGLLWWNNADASIPDVPTDAYWSWGLNDRLIVIMPGLGIVAARAGSPWAGDRSPSFYQVLEPFLRPIAQSVIDPGPGPTPGEAGLGIHLLVTGHDENTDEISISYGLACDSSDNTIQFGPLTRADIADYNYTGQDCFIGNDGTYEAFDPGPGSYFFLVVANDGFAYEGSYGTDDLGGERPSFEDAPVCPLLQEMGRRCD